jgi:hypothetical protein
MSATMTVKIARKRAYVTSAAPAGRKSGEEPGDAAFDLADDRLLGALSEYRAEKLPDSNPANRTRLLKELTRYIDQITIGNGRRLGPLAREFGLHDLDSASELGVALKTYYLKPARGTILGTWDARKGRKITSYIWEKGKGCARDILRQRLVDTINASLDEKGSLRGQSDARRINVRQLADSLMAQLSSAKYSSQTRQAILAKVHSIVEESIENYDLGADGKSPQPLPGELTHGSGETAMASKLRMSRALSDFRRICNDMPGARVKLHDGTVVTATDGMVTMFLEYLCVLDPTSLQLDESMAAFVERKRQDAALAASRHEAQAHALAQRRGHSLSFLKSTIEVGVRFITLHKHFDLLCELLVPERFRKDATPEAVREAGRRIAVLLRDARTPGVQSQAIFIECVRGWVASSLID